MEPLPNLDDFDRMNPLEKIRCLAEARAQTALLRGEMAKYYSEMKAIAIRTGVSLMGLEGDRVVWRGRPLEWVLAERRDVSDEDEGDTPSDEAGFEDGEDGETGDGHREEGPWPVNVEVDLLARLRKDGFDLGALLAEHSRHCEGDGMVKATARQLLSNEWIAVLTVVDMDQINQVTYIYSINRTA